MIVPTLNERDNLGSLLDSLERQSKSPLEVVVVDGGSVDGTADIARRRGARTLVCPGVAEFPSRNLGADLARGDILLFTGADVVFGPRLVARIGARFDSDLSLLAVAGPGIPARPPLLLGLEYAVYNLVRYGAGTLPRPFKRFTSSTNLLAVRRDAFESLGRFSADFNADGTFGARLCAAGKVHFSLFGIRCRISSRRLHAMGFVGFNRHFLYVLENFIPRTARWSVVRRRKEEAARSHFNMRELPRRAVLSDTREPLEMEGSVPG